MTKNKKISVQGIDIVLYEDKEKDFFSLTDIARHKDAAHTDDIIKKRMRNRNTIELLGFWETIYNPNFKPVEFDGFRKQAGERLKQLNKVAIAQMKSLLDNNEIKQLNEENKMKNNQQTEVPDFKVQRSDFYTPANFES